jgi:1-phosphofructokinase
MLHIICLNTSIDVKIELDLFELGKVQKSLQVSSFPSGKGVNCAFACDYLGLPAHLYAIVGSLDANFFRNIRFKSVDLKCFEAHGETRRNITLLDRTGLVAHIRNDGYECSDEFCAKMIHDTVKCVGDGDVFLMSGSIPHGFSISYIGQLMEGVKERGATTVLDSDLAVLEELNSGTIDIVKPNIEELMEFMSYTETEHASGAIEIFRRHGVNCCIVSCGSFGAFLFDFVGEVTLFATSKFIGSGSDSIGSGDAFMGAFCGSVARGHPLVQALRMGASAGHSNLFHAGPGRIGSTFGEILEKIEVGVTDRAEAINAIDQLIKSRQFQ